MVIISTMTTKSHASVRPPRVPHPECHAPCRRHDAGTGAEPDAETVGTLFNWYYAPRSHRAYTVGDTVSRC